MFIKFKWGSTFQLIGSDAYDATVGAGPVWISYSEWALANLTLPIVRTADTLTVIVESPIKTKAVEELRARTHLDIQLALASPSNSRTIGASPARSQMSLL